MNEFELAYYYRQNPTLAFDYLLAKYQQFLYKCIHQTCFSFDCSAFNIDDCYQEAVMTLITTLDTYREDKQTSFTTYLYYCAMFRIRGFIKSLRGFNDKMNIQTISFSTPTTMDGSMTLQDTIEDQSSWGRPDTMANFFDLVSEINEKLLEYDSMTQRVFMLRNHGLSYQQIALDCNISEKKVDNLLQKIRRQFKE